MADCVPGHRDFFFFFFEKNSLCEALNLCHMPVGNKHALKRLLHVEAINKTNFKKLRDTLRLV